MSHPSIRLTVSLAAVAALAISTIAGCAADSGGELTREEFVEQANAVCASGNAEIGAAIPSDGEWPPSGETEEAMFQTIVQSIHRQIDEITALDGPDDIETEVDAVVADARLIVADMETQGMDTFFASDEDPFAAVNARFSALGITECAQDPEE